MDNNLLNGLTREEFIDTLKRGYCPYCGKGPYKSILVHVSRVHDVSAYRVREIADLGRESRLCSDQYSEERKAIAIKINAASHLDPGKGISRGSKGTKMRKESIDKFKLRELSAETIAKQVEARRPLWDDPAFREKMKKAGFDGTGRQDSEETRLKRSLAHKGKVFSAEHRQNLSIAKKGRKLSEEHRKKLSIASIEHNANAHINADIAREIKLRLATGKETSQQIAIACNTTRYVVADISAGRSWKHVVISEK